MTYITIIPIWTKFRKDNKSIERGERLLLRVVKSTRRKYCIVSFIHQIFAYPNWQDKNMLCFSMNKRVAGNLAMILNKMDGEL